MAEASEIVGRSADLLGYETNQYPLNLNREPFSSIKKLRVEIQNYKKCEDHVENESLFQSYYHMCGDSIINSQLADSVRRTPLHHFCFLKFNYLDFFIHYLKI